MRFIGQGYEINVDLPVGMDPPDFRKRLSLPTPRPTASALSPGRNLVRVSQAAVDRACQLPKLTFPETSASEKGFGQPVKHRQVYFPETNGFTNCPVYDRYSLRAVATASKARVDRERESTIVILPNSVAMSTAPQHHRRPPVTLNKD